MDFVSSVNNEIPPLSPIFVKSAISPDISFKSSDNSSVSSSYPRHYCCSFCFITKRGRSFLPTSTVSFLDYICRSDHTFIRLARMTRICSIITNTTVISTGIGFPYPRYCLSLGFHRFERVVNLYVTI